MNKYVNSEVKQHMMKLLLMGADVKVVSGKTVYVKFLLEPDIKLSYVYHVNKNNKYFLERIKPYPISIKEFDSVEDVVEIIKIDYMQYKNASHSKKIDRFINISNDLHKTIKSFEDLFLYYNIPNDVVTNIEREVKEIKDSIRAAAGDCTRVYFDKDPENL